MSRQALRVALVAEMPPPDAGMPVQAGLLIAGLRDEGIEMIAVEARPRFRGAWARLERLPVLRGLARAPRYLWSLRSIASADVAHIFACSGGSFWVQTVPAILVARARRVPALVHYHGGAAERFFKGSRLARRMLRLADRIVVPSGFLHEVFRRLGLDVAVVPNPLAIERFEYRDRPFAGLRILACRNLRRVYDVATALRAFARLLEICPEARLVVAGDGPQRAGLEALASRLGIAARTEFVGRVPNERMPALMAQADVVLNTPLEDNLPGSVLEAMASGAAVVSTDVGGVPWLIQDGINGRLATAGDDRTLAQQMAWLAADAERARELTRRARRLAEHHGWSQVAPGWIDLYRRLRVADAARRSASRSGRIAGRRPGVTR